MNRDLYHSNQLPISANEGWQQMQLLLNKQLPVQKQFTGTKKILVYTAILLLCSGSMFISLPLNAPLLFSVIRVGHDAVPAMVNSHINFLQAKNYSKKNADTLHFFKPLTGNILTHPNLVVAAEILLPGSDKLSAMNAIINPLSTAKEDENTATFRQPVNTPDTTVTPAATGTPATAEVEKRKAKSKPFWSLLAGISINAVVGTHQNLQPYPMVVARYHINKQLYVAATVTAYSPVASNVSGVTKTVYANDTANNVQLYKETTTHNTLYYADIPLTAGISISKKVAVQAGVQLSVLLNKKTTTTLAPYDFLINGISSAIIPQSAFAGRQTETPLSVRKIDYRFVTGVRYTINKTVFGLDYQQSLQPAGKGSGTTCNKVIALSVVLKIK
jgi:hypothetical protein